MKDKIIYLILGILIGAIITAGCFLLFTQNKGPQAGRNGEFPQGNFIEGDRPDREANNKISSQNNI